MRLDVIKDPSLDAFFGHDLAEDMRNSIHAGGDCRACGKQLTSGQKVRLDASTDGFIPHVWARHATCQPTTATPMAASTLTEMTWMTSGGLVPVGGTAFQKPRLVAVAILNPSVDGFAFSPYIQEWPSSLNEWYLSQGLSKPGELSMGTPSNPNWKARWIGDAVAFDLIPLGMGYEADMPPQALSAIKDWGGLMVIVTHAEVPAEVSSSKQKFATFMSAGDYTTAWLDVV
ncbi:hypothetical protein ACIQTW_21185 [Paenarthrobacter sp. NPDC090517]|uniref:hypothetical protein n=1 Tax=Paenarthrobacter sp. NPDC090517 TaxID=3364381 RepID=UPI003830BCEC